MQHFTWPTGARAFECPSSTCSVHRRFPGGHQPDDRGMADARK